MKLLHKYNCILCKYNKYNKGNDSCFNHMEKDTYGYPIEKCRSLSNIYYGTILKFFPFKQIHDFRTERAWRKEEKYNEEMDKKYGDCALENDDILCASMIFDEKAKSLVCGVYYCIFYCLLYIYGTTL